MQSSSHGLSTLVAVSEYGMCVHIRKNSFTYAEDDDIFCFKLKKNATETYVMLQTALGPSCMNRASVFE